MLGKSRIQKYLIFVVVFFLLFTTISSAEGVKGLSFWQTGGFCFLCVFTVCALRKSTQARVMVNISSNLHLGSQTTHLFAPVSNLFNQMLWSYIRNAIVSIILYNIHLISQITHLSLFKIDTHECLPLCQTYLTKRPDDLSEFRNITCKRGFPYPYPSAQHTNNVHSDLRQTPSLQIRQMK